MSNDNGRAPALAPGARLSRQNDQQVTEFCVAAPDATLVYLCRFDAQGREERYPMQRDSGGLWCCTRSDCPPGTQYGYRAEGQFAPDAGYWFNPAKLLLDPYAKQISGELAWHASLFEPKAGERSPRACKEDTAAFVPRGVVVDDAFDWRGDVRPQIPWTDTVIYELHVKGYTHLHPDVPLPQRGKYLALQHAAVIEHFRHVGVTSLQLMPTAAFLSEHHLFQKGLVNYWGYNPIALFAPHAGYAVADPVLEFKTMVQGLHAAGIEVILDIVLNHTAEADHGGPTLSMRGLDNAAWYRLVPGKPRYYENYSGCGNSLNTAHPATLDFTLACLRYWVEVMHVDGFRFDLAASLGRDADGQFNRHSEFFERVRSDPCLSEVKLIAEPWDVGPNGYQLGNFPEPWRECNGGYRDEVRGFWNHRSVNTGTFAERIAGSSDLYHHAGRAPTASVNFITCHDGFTLRDLVSYERKHNEKNAEANRDGNNYNISANHGVEGPSDDPAILSLRLRQQQNFLATLVLSQGVPQLLAGDEMGHSQAGNNNAYCQDNETSWIDWGMLRRDSTLTAFVGGLLHIRKNCLAFRRAQFLTGQAPPGQARVSAIKDVAWLHPSGREMMAADWHDPHLHCLGMLLAESGNGAAGTTYAHLVLFNAALESVEFMLPECPAGSAWTRLFDTGEHSPALPFSSRTYRLGGRACAGFSEPLGPGT